MLVVLVMEHCGVTAGNYRLLQIWQCSVVTVGNWNISDNFGTLCVVL